MNNVIPLPRTTPDSYEIIVLEASFPDLMMQAVQALQENKAVIIRLDHLDKYQAQRILDFISGSVYVIAGQPLKVGSDVFLFTPHHIQIQSGLAG